jgi:hypothetical protein
MPTVSASHVSWSTKGRLFLDLLGRPLVNGMGNAEPSLLSQALGATGLALLAMTLIFLRKKIRANLPAILLVSWALLVALQIAFARAAVAPWYASPMAFFWAGFLLLTTSTPAAIRTAGFLMITVLALRVQGTWEDKSFYLPSRTPASAACLREWRTAPPSCHARVFQWGEEGHAGELALLGESLEKRDLSVFGPHRTYLLQGDVPLGRVLLEPGTAPTFFTADGRTRRDVDDFRRLDFVLSPDSTVAWLVDLPPNLTSARFRTRVHATPGGAQLGRGAHVSVTPAGSSLALDARAFVPAETTAPLEVDLSTWAGKRITVTLAADETHEAALPLIFEAPRIELRLGGRS